MDWFRKVMKGNLAGWRRTSGRAGSRGARSDRAETHQKSRHVLKEQLRHDIEEENG